MNGQERYFSHPRTDGNNSKARAMDGFMETRIRLQETNSDNSVSDCRKQILTTAYQTAGNKFWQQHIRLQETNSDSSVSDCRKQIL